MSILLTPLALGYEQPEDAIVWHCKKSNDLNVGASPIPSPKIIPDQWKGVHRLHTLGGEQDVALVSKVLG